ncbi:MAG: hypothetical protein LBQ66_12130 [Planctomycetaceae bacterium]|jgi:hypothetical protein|nr:hypothetical protein [Planctomycetaceae bacterium]
MKSTILSIRNLAVILFAFSVMLITGVADGDTPQYVVLSVAGGTPTEGENVENEDVNVTDENIFSTGTSYTFCINGTINWEPQEHVEARPVQVLWHYNGATLTGGDGTLTATPGADSQDTWTESSSRTVSISVSSPDKYELTFSISAKMEQQNSDGTPRQDSSGNNLYTSLGTATQSVIIWVIGIDSIQYKRSTDSDWQSATSTIYVRKNEALSFKANKTPTDASSFPANQPVWSGTAGATGNSETVSVTFDTTASTTTDYKTVIASCGTNSKTVNVIVYEFDSLTVTETACTTNSLTKPDSTESTLYVCKKDNDNTKISLSMKLTPDVTAANDMVRWTVEGDVATQSSGSFSDSCEVTLKPSDDTKHTFTVKAGLDTNRDGTLGSDEVSETITVVVMELKSVSISANCQDGTSKSATNPSDSEVYFSCAWGADLTANLTVVSNPNTLEVHSRVRWSIIGDKATPTSGDFSNQSSVVLSHIGNREYTFKAGLDANCNSSLQNDEVAHTIKVRILSVKLTPENAGGAAGAVPMTECMEGRQITYTATMNSWSDLGNVKYKFYFKEADGTDWTQDKEVASNTVETTDIYSDKVSNSTESTAATDDYFTTPVYVTATYKGVTAISDTLNIKVYRLGIKKFGDEADKKDWKVCVGRSIEYEANSSSDCQNFEWDLKSGTFSNYWQTDGGTAKSGTDMKIKYSSLAKAYNSWFGDTYGNVRVKCKDGDNNSYTFESVNMSTPKKTQVFFPPDLNVDGGTPTTDKPPCWFVFWKDGGVVNEISQFKFTTDMVNGMYDGQLHLGNTCLHKRTATTLTRKNRTGYPPITVTITGNDEYIDGVAGTISHELYHKFTYDNTATDSDGDMVTDAREQTPEKSHFPITFYDDRDSFELSVNLPAYATYTRGDQEFRCRLENIHSKQTIDKSKDWAADDRNPLWK